MRCLVMMVLGVNVASAADVTWSGRLLDTNGGPLNDTLSLQVEMKDLGVTVGTWTFTAIPVVDGYVSVVLTDVEPEWVGPSTTLDVTAGSALVVDGQPLRDVPSAATSEQLYRRFDNADHAGWVVDPTFHTLEARVGDGGGTSTPLVLGNGVVGVEGTLDVNATAPVHVDGDDLVVGASTTTRPNRVRVVSGDAHEAIVEAYGDEQGTGRMYVGQDEVFGGGLLYNGDDTPDVVGGTDRITFYRRAGGTDAEVFSYPYDGSTVTFEGVVDASNFTTRTGDITLGNGITGTHNTIRVQADQTHTARLEAFGFGGSQGSGMVYAGQSADHGGGFAYDGDGTPDIVGGNDRVTHFRRTSGSDIEVFSFAHNNSTVTFATSISQSSDERLKQRIEDLHNSLDVIDRLRGVTYEWRDERALGPQYGFVAQEVQDVLPEIVHEGSDGYLSVEYMALLPVLVEAVQELRAENAELRRAVQALGEGVADQAE